LSAGRRRAASIALLCGLVSATAGAPPARAVKAHARDAAAAAARARPHAAGWAAGGAAEQATPRAPSGPPLVTADAAADGSELVAQSDAGADASSSAPASGGDPLEANGLGSPLCAAAAELSAASRSNCATSGFEAAGAPTGDYGLDVHIDTGALGFTAATLEQDYLIGPVWMSLVWIVHTLVVALEWCFQLDLLDGSAMNGVERALRDTEAGFTRPWLVSALALAALAAAYNGLVRRRVAETLGQAALMLAMMAGGLWVIADPAGTVGALGRWVDEASAGTVGAVVQGTPAHAPRTLADSMGGLFAGVVGAPWCYLEFGNVRWCSQPSALDGRLRAAGLRVAAAAASTGGCAGDGETWGSSGACQTLEGEPQAQRAQSATLLRQARTNGELFLALPADQAARNSINDRASLLRVLCGSSDATDCRGSTASEAEFRTQGGTGARLGGLLLIALGALGAILLLGFIALHLLGSELLGLLYLLLAPAAVIAPALGDGGRGAFRAWATRLLGALTSKLLFSFLLGVVLLLTRTLLELSAFGWWTRWLLLAALWWGSFLQRHRVLGYVQGDLRASAGARAGAAGAGASTSAAHGGGRLPSALSGQPGHRQSLARRVQRQLESPLAAARAAQWMRRTLAKPAPDVTPKANRDGARFSGTAAEIDEQARGMLRHEHRQALREVADAPRARAQLRARHAQLQRVRRARAQAAAAGDTRRSTLLDIRARRIESETAGIRARLTAAHATVAQGGATARTSARRDTRAAVRERARFLDAQAALPAGGRAGIKPADHTVAADTRATMGDRMVTYGGSWAPRRDYAALAGLAGYGREHYLRLDPRHRREARLKIDRELALRRQLGASTHRLGVPGSSSEPAGPSVSGARERVRPRRPVSARESTYSRESPSPSPSPSPAAGAAARASEGGSESRLMREAREVAQRRKRQLGGR
jgi:hypothetical protein